MIRPTLAETVTAMERTMRSAQLSGRDIDHVLLVGGSSRIPLVGQLVSAGLGRPVAIDAHPKHAIALGAAHVAARASGVATADAHTRSTQAVGGGAALPAPPAGVIAPPASDPLAGSRPAPPTPPPGRSVFDSPRPVARRRVRGRGRRRRLRPRLRPRRHHRLPRHHGADRAAPGRPAPRPGPARAAGAAHGAALVLRRPARAGGAAAAAAAARASGRARRATCPHRPPLRRRAAGARLLPAAGRLPPAGRLPAAGRASGLRAAARAGPSTGWQGSYADPTFDAAGREAPPPSLGYRAAGSPPPPGQSYDLPPGILSPEERAARQASEQRKAKLNAIVGVVVLVLVVAAALAAVLL